MNVKTIRRKQFLDAAGLCLLCFCTASSQFIDRFDNAVLLTDSRGVNGWTYYTGDGSAVMNFSATGKGHASINVDATKDKRGIWWALIRRRVSKDMNLSLLRDPRYALRIEARIRVSDAPKRVNLHLNTQRTTDFHSHLMEFDIPDTLRWHTISMTTKGFDAGPRDTVYAQLALMDWGLERYTVQLDYVKVDIVRTDTAGPDQGVQVPYHPTIPDPGLFVYHLPAAQEATVDIQYPDLHFNNWYTREDTLKTNILTVNSTQFIILRWDLAAFRQKKVTGSGLLELTTHSLQRSSDYLKDFGMVRIVEIIGGDTAWDQQNVTYSSLCRGNPLARVLNSQMIIDIDVGEMRGTRNLATIPNPVLQRMVDGKTFGIAIQPLGAVGASFYKEQNHKGVSEGILHLNLGNFPPTPTEEGR